MYINPSFKIIKDTGYSEQIEFTVNIEIQDTINKIKNHTDSFTDKEKHIIKDLIKLNIVSNVNYFGIPEHTINTFFQATIGDFLTDIVEEKESIGLFSIPYFEGSKYGYDNNSIEYLKINSLLLPGINNSSSLEGKLYQEITDYGNIEIEKNLILELEKISRLIKNSNIFPIFIGGDHSITYPIIKGMYNDNMRVVKFDAHSDLSSKGNKLKHNNVFSYIDGLNNVEIIHFGLSEYSNHKENLSIKKHTIFNDIKKLVDYLNSQRDIPTYVSVDLDVFNSNVISSVHYPSFFGISSQEFIYFIDEFVKDNKQVLGIDFVEYDAQNDFGYVCAKSITELIYHYIKKISELNNE